MSNAKESDVIKTAVRYVEVDSNHHGQRLDNLLLGEIKGAPKSLIYRLIRTGQVRVNGGRAKPMQKVKYGDKVRIPPVESRPEQKRARFDDQTIADFRDAIIHEDGDHLVIDKPAGLAVHSGTGVDFGVIDIARQATGLDFIELAHRLDRETSGCLILAKSRPALLDLQTAFRTQMVDKMYLALLHGKLGDDPRRVTLPLRRGAERGGERLVIVDPEKGKPADTVFTPIERYGNFTLVQAKIATGRTHQIRVHAESMGTPVAGDQKYGDTDHGKIRRLFLHCSMMAIDFDTPDREQLVVNSPLPDDLRRTLDQLTRRR